MEYNNRNQGGGNRPRVEGSNSWNRSQSKRDGERESADDVFNRLKFEDSWITKEATVKLVDYAEYAGKFMANNDLTNSKIRSIFNEIKRIQMGIFENEKSSFYLLKPKVAYALGRDKKNEGLKLFKKIFDQCYPSVTDQKSYQNFCGFIEAILAYHKAYGGKD